MRKMNLLLILLLITTVFPIAQQKQKTVEEIMEEQRKALQDIQAQDQAYMQQVADDFRYYQEEISREYEAYEKQIKAEMEAMEAAIKKKWEEFRHDTNEEMVDYDQDLNARGSVDFKKGVVEVEVIQEADDPQAEEKAQARIKKKLKDLTEKKSADDKPLLKDQLKTDTGTKVTRANAETFTKKVVEKKEIKQKKYQSRDGKTRVKYSVKVSLVPNHIEIRAKEFRQEVLKQAKRFNIDPGVAFAVMHTESYFNPRAKSYIPAFGLMQLVPRSGARDAYNYVYKQDRLLKADYLYVPNNNIELGCAYLSKIRYVYFKNITNDEKAWYCTICAYNTGPGNVARAITGTTKLGSTSRTVNANKPQWVYQKLARDLPYDETKHYLKKVNELVKMYQTWI